MQMRDILTEFLQVISNLQTKFTRRTKYDSLCLLAACINTLQQRQTECGRLTRTSLCQCDDVVTITK